MSEAEVAIAPVSEHGQLGQDTHSSIVHSDSHSQHQNSEAEPTNSEGTNEFDDSGVAPDSSRGSTAATGEDDAYSMYGRMPRPFVGRSMWEMNREE
jgi:hypothetical protein